MADSRLWWLVGAVFSPDLAYCATCARICPKVRIRTRLHAAIVVVTLTWSVVITWVLLKLVGVFVPLRISREHELVGLDISQHGEALQ